MKDYPAWICADCGARLGRIIAGHLCTFHAPDKTDPTDRCGWCGTNDCALTEPRDYKYPPAPRRKP